MTCDGSTRVWELAPSEVVALDGARGATLRVTRGRVWLTQHGDTRDIFLGAGDAFTIERGGRTVVEAQEAATLCVPARYIDPVRSRAVQSSFGTRAWASWNSIVAFARRRGVTSPSA
jgi:hypothetical protein